MNEGPHLAKLAALLADPSRARMLGLLMPGQALTATELADACGIARPTASGHLGALVDAGLLSPAAQGRHRYFRLAGPEVAEALEQLIGIAERLGQHALQPGPRDAALREARVCYDHVAGRAGVGLLGRLLGVDALRPARDGALAPGPALAAVLAPLGLAPERLAPSRPPLCRACLDWSERRDHLAGRLGSALLEHALAQGWAARPAGSRVLQFTAEGRQRWDAIGAGL
ncbi:MAG: winged helix-turn-helix transcriptional regulator [Pelomonas sp.]|nr:winged helix-turn-helix transcriptional regulator [Roseateles sp.]